MIKQIQVIDLSLANYFMCNTQDSNSDSMYYKPTARTTTLCINLHTTEGFLSILKIPSKSISSYAMCFQCVVAVNSYNYNHTMALLQMARYRLEFSRTTAQLDRILKYSCCLTLRTAPSGKTFF